VTAHDVSGFKKGSPKENSCGQKKLLGGAALQRCDKVLTKARL